MKRKLPLNPKRLIIKVGTGVLTTKNFQLDRGWIKKLVAQIVILLSRNIEVILVTSGAIGAGMGALGLNSRPRLLPQQQACAAIGQGQLMKIYDAFFRRHGIVSAQILLTREDLSNRKRYLNAKNTLSTLSAYKVVPIINENDTVSVDEIKFGDNDKLSALVANLVHADLLIILSNVDGLYAPISKEKGAGAENMVIAKVEKITPQIERIAGSRTSRAGIGGMASKLEAAKICCAAGITCIFANGRTSNILLKLLDGQNIGTLFLPQKKQLVAKKRWIQFSAKVNGQIMVDEGAKEALIAKNKSLLPKGVIKLRGNFALGDIVSILDNQNREFARGLVNYSSGELNKIKGQKSDQIKPILGYKYYDEAIHRDNLVIL
jgi:glutamate 5-kinase